MSREKYVVQLTDDARESLQLSDNTDGGRTCLQVLYEKFCYRAHGLRRQSPWLAAEVSTGR